MLSYPPIVVQTSSIAGLLSISVFVNEFRWVLRPTLHYYLAGLRHLRDIRTPPQPFLLYSPTMRVTIGPYNFAWLIHFQKFKNSLQDILRDILIRSIEHFGSTSIPLPAIRATLVEAG